MGLEGGGLDVRFTPDMLMVGRSGYCWIVVRIVPANEELGGAIHPVITVLPPTAIEKLGFLNDENRTVNELKPGANDMLMRQKGLGQAVVPYQLTEAFDHFCHAESREMRWR